MQGWLAANGCLWRLLGFLPRPSLGSTVLLGGGRAVAGCPSPLLVAGASPDSPSGSVLHLERPHRASVSTMSMLHATCGAFISFLPNCILSLYLMQCGSETNSFRFFYLSFTFVVIDNKAVFDFDIDLGGCHIGLFNFVNLEDAHWLMPWQSANLPGVHS